MVFGKQSMSGYVVDTMSSFPSIAYVSALAHKPLHEKDVSFSNVSFAL